MFKIVIHEVPEAFFTGEIRSVAKAPEGRSHDRLRAISSRRGDNSQVKEWQKRAEETAKRYAALLQAYKQLKAKVDASPDWRGRCQKMLNELLRVVNACDFTSAVDRSADPAPTLDALLTGIQQLRDQMLQFLCDLSLLQVVEPRPGEKFDRIRCMAVGTTHAADTTNAVVSEVVECGFMHNDQVVKQAKVKLATPETTEGKR